jgi:16S rRNA (uracil1498-N3)-methyltransferase
MPAAAKVRLHVAHPVGEGQTVPIDRDQAHYLFGVMRLGPGDRLMIFNQTSGEWLAEVAARRASAAACCGASSRRSRADAGGCLAPVRADQEGADGFHRGEGDGTGRGGDPAGADRVHPVRAGAGSTGCRRMPSRRPSSAAGRSCPRCGSSRPLDRLLADWPAGRRLMFCDEGLGGAGRGLAGAGRGPGRFSSALRAGSRTAERAALAGAALRDGREPRPRILRADTAAVAALTLWQAALGDWR